MTKTKFKIFLIPLFLMLVVVSLCGCQTSMDSKDVYAKFVEYAKAENNIFEVTQTQNNAIVSIKIGYADEINTILCDETKMYKEDGETPRTDFYLLKNVYEPTLNYSLNFFLTNLNFLKAKNEDIEKEDAGLIFDNFHNLQNSIEDFQITLGRLNTFASEFENIYDKRDKMVFTILDTFKVKYAHLIESSFTLNNSFMELYFKTYNTTLTDYRKDATKDIVGFDVQMLCNQAVSTLGQVGFLVDGVECNFMKTKKSTFDINNANNKEILDYTYIENLEQILISSGYLLNLPSEKFQALDGRNELRNDIIVLQNQLEIFNNQYSSLKKALDSIDYRAFVSLITDLEYEEIVLKTEDDFFVQKIMETLNKNESEAREYYLFWKEYIESDINFIGDTEIRLFFTQTKEAYEEYVVTETNRIQDSRQDYIESGKIIDDYYGKLTKEEKSYFFIIQDYMNNKYSSLCSIVNGLVQKITNLTTD